jgi:NAD(P)-dependent dehydrogenase (short-subunit alcohol dehydrogenase family)
MNNQQRLALAIATGVGAALIGVRLARTRLAISFEDRVVLITGGSRGLGLVMARIFAAEGAKVVLLARHMAELERAREELESHGGRVMAIRCDVRRRADVRAAIDSVVDHWNAIDVLVNNAGVVQVGPLEHMTEEDFENTMATHFWGPLHLILEVVPIMRHRGFGRIVNVSSIGGQLALPHLAPYSASKSALIGLSDAVRAELDPHGIRVTTVTPGLIRTGSPLNALYKGNHQHEYAWFKTVSSIPGLTMSAERAARRIVDACRYGDPHLTLTPHASLAATANVVLPAAVARAMMLMSRLLPGPDSSQGNVARRGREIDGRLVPVLATRLTDRAAVANNEV